MTPPEPIKTTTTTTTTTAAAAVMVGTSFQYTTVSPSIVIHAVGRSIDRISIQSKISGGGGGVKKNGARVNLGHWEFFPFSERDPFTGPHN